MCVRGIETDVKKNSTCGILKNKYGMIVIYWPSIELSFKRCTCVNKRKNSGSRWAWVNYITRCTNGSSWNMSQLETRCRIESQWQTEDFGPSVTHSWATQPRWGRSAAMVRRTWGQYIAVCPHLQLTSHTQETSTLSRIDCERLYFYKEVCLFVHWSRHYCWLCFRLYLYIYCVVVCGYTTTMSIFNDHSNYTTGTSISIIAPPET